MVEDSLKEVPVVDHAVPHVRGHLHALPGIRQRHRVHVLVVGPVRMRPDEGRHLRPGQVLPGMADPEGVVAGVKNLKNLGFLICLLLVLI